MPLDADRFIWRASPSQRALIECPVFEVFFGGARGGGKTDGMLGDFVVHAEQYGEHAIGLMVRRTRTELIETIERSKVLYPSLGAIYHSQEGMWRFANGARLRFAYLERDSDADAYQGHSYTRVYVEEIGNFPSQAPIMKLMATLRSGAGVPCRFRATGNPGGAGHQWVKARYIDPAPKGWKVTTEGNRERVFIPSHVGDNPHLAADYVDNLRMSGSPELVRAWLEGDWNVIAGAFFPEFGPHHIIPARSLPDMWPRFRSADWGSARPFSVGWWAISDGQLSGLPRGALVRYREWYGWNGKPNEGLKLTAEEVGAGILERDAGENIQNGASVLDPAAFANDGGPSIAERIHAGSGRKVDFRRADNRRIARLGAMGGWDQVRGRLKGEDGRPMIYFMDNCIHAIRTLPALQHDELKPEDVDTEAEDHAPDECFVAGTLITTPIGPMPIEQLRVGSVVETSDGPRSVSAVFSVGERSVFRVLMSDGDELVGTGKHPVFIEEYGYLPLSELRYGDMMRPWSTQTNIGASPGIFGRSIADQSREDLSFTTGTRTRPTTIYRIWNACLRAIIGGITSRTRNALRECVSGAAALIKQLCAGRRAFAPMLASQGIGGPSRSTMSTGYAPGATRHSPPIASRDSAFARSHARRPEATSVPFGNTNATSAETSSTRETTAQSGALRAVVSVTPAGVQRVYNLTVDGPENYFASGVLVHNCRYACMSRPYLPRNQPKQEPVFHSIPIGGVPQPGNLRAPTLDQLWKDHDHARTTGWR